jgi:uncharacterized protein YqeY
MCLRCGEILTEFEVVFPELGGGMGRNSAAFGEMVTIAEETKDGKWWIVSMSESLEARVKQQTITAMKAHDSERTTTLRLITTALKNRAIEKRIDLAVGLPEAEAQQILATMIKQRRDSIEQFTKGNRPELAAKEAVEIGVIEEFLPKALTDEALSALVGQVVAAVAEGAGQKPTPKEMGTVIKAVQAKLQAEGLRAEGRGVSEAVKAALA